MVCFIRRLVGSVSKRLSTFRSQLRRNSAKGQAESHRRGPWKMAETDEKFALLEPSDSFVTPRHPGESQFELTALVPEDPVKTLTPSSTDKSEATEPLTSATEQPNSDEFCCPSSSQNVTEASVHCRPEELRVENCLTAAADVKRPSKEGSFDSDKSDEKEKSEGPSHSSAKWTHSNLAGTDGEGRKKKREDKIVDSVLKVLSVLSTPEEKLSALCMKYAELCEESRVMQRTLKQTQKMYSSILKDKEHLESENSKLILSKNKLETLCRELQKVNKSIKEESLHRAKEQEEKRREISDKFQISLNELHAAMASGRDRSTKLHEENTNLAKKLQLLVDQYEAKDEHSKKLLGTKDLEVQLLEAKLQTAVLQNQQLTEVHLKEKEQFLLIMKEKDEQLTMLITNEGHLKTQLALYSEKYDDFQTSLKKSNEVFQNFKSEMDKMTKKMAKLDKETRQWKGKWETSNKALIEAVDQKMKTDKECHQLSQKNTNLEKLCRALQAQRKSPKPDEEMQNGVKDEKSHQNGIETVAVNGADSKVDEAPAIAVVCNDSVPEVLLMASADCSAETSKNETSEVVVSSESAAENGHTEEESSVEVPLCPSPTGTSAVQ